MSDAQDKVPATNNEDVAIDSGVDSVAYSRSKRGRRGSRSRMKSRQSADSTSVCQSQRDAADTTLSKVSSRVSDSASVKSVESKRSTLSRVSSKMAKANEKPSHDTASTGPILVGDTGAEGKPEVTPVEASCFPPEYPAQKTAADQATEYAANPARQNVAGTASESLNPQRVGSDQDVIRESVAAQQRTETTKEPTPALMCVLPAPFDEHPRSATELSAVAKADLQQSPQFDKVDHLVACSLSGMQSQQRTQRQNCKPCVLCFASFVILLSLVFIVISLHRSANNGSVVCETEDCRLHAALITADMDTALDPCNDFSARVCSAWEHRRSLVARSVTGLHPSAHADAVSEWLMNLPYTIDAGTQRVPTGDRARVMYDACVNHTDGSEMTLLRKFMAELGIPWPDRPATGVSPLGVLINLAYNYHTALWFSIRLVSTSSVRVVVIGPGQYVVPASRRHERLTAVGGYEEYWQAYYDSFSSASHKNPKPRGAGDFGAKPSARMQSFVLAVLSNATASQAKRNAFRSRFKIEQFDKLTVKVPASEWLSELNRHLKPPESLAPTDEVFANGIDISSAIRAIFDRYTRYDVLEQIGWLFADIYGPLVDDKLLSRKFGESNAVAARIALCATEVEKAFQPLVAALYVVSRFSAETKKAVTEKLHAVVDTAGSMINGALWMDNYSRELLRMKIHDASRDLWPPLIMLSQTGLSAMYAQFPSKWNSFLGTWIAVQKLSADLKHRNFGYNNLPSLLVGYQLPLFDYDYISNSVFTSVAALTSPFYYANGTKSMFYAGLGFFFAKELVRAIDDTGVTIDLTGREADVSRKTGDLSGNVTDLWLTAAAIASSHNRAACLMPKHASVFPEVPELQIAYAAYKTALADGEKNLRVAYQYTEDQMFFLTLCYLMCSLPDKVEPPMRDCNKAVSSFPAFGDAFGCAHDAPMSAYLPTVTPPLYAVLA
nr:endothelin-converting enzyme 1-like [Rhipicephalus microplus]